MNANIGVSGQYLYIFRGGKLNPLLLLLDTMCQIWNRSNTRKWGQTRFVFSYCLLYREIVLLWPNIESKKKEDNVLEKIKLYLLLTRWRQYRVLIRRLNYPGFPRSICHIRRKTYRTTKDRKEKVEM